MSWHTPGPWKAMWSGRSGGGNVAPENRHYSIYATAPAIPGFIGPRDVELCDLRGMIDGRTNAANANLIAAAPELLRELVHLRRCLHPWLEAGHNVPGIATLNGADAAIAKAEGREP